MPFKSMLWIFVGVMAGVLIFPSEAMIVVWLGGMALLWIITGKWVPAQPPNSQKPDHPVHSAEIVRPHEASQEHEDLELLERLDGVERSAERAAENPPTTQG